MSKSPPLDERFDTIVERYDLGARTLDIMHPRNADDLITEADYVMDERLPYWADIWPASTALAGFVTRAAPVFDRGRALELGCGSGLVTCAALSAGWSVVATDYYEDALLFTHANATRNRLRAPTTRMVNWRSFPDDLGEFELILASDVLYEREYATLLAKAIATCLTPLGRALFADPGRSAVEDFHDDCEALSLRTALLERIPYESGEIRQSISIFEITREPTV